MVPLQKTVERVFQLAVVQLWSPIDHSLCSICDRVSMRSLVVVEETNIVFQIRLLQFSISQLLKCNRLEVSLEKMHSILSDRTSILLCSKDQYQAKKQRLDASSMHCACIETWYREVNIFRISVTFISWINKQEEHRLSSAQIFTSRYQSIVDS